MIFPHVYLNFTCQETLPSSLYHPTRIMVFLTPHVTWLELKCNSFYTPAREAISNYSKIYSIIQNNLRLLNINSSHLKIVLTVLAHQPQIKMMYLTRTSLSLFHIL